MNSAARKNYLRPCRKKLGLSQLQLGHIIGVRTGMRVSLLENGLALPTIAECLAFERLFNRSFPELWPQMAVELDSLAHGRIRGLLTNVESTVARSRRRRLRLTCVRKRLAAVIADVVEV